MTLAQRFLCEVAGALVREGQTGPDPSAWARACVQVLPVQGATVIVARGELRVPLGSSSVEAAAAERLQATLGEGPFLDSDVDGLTVRAGEMALAARWPIFHRELVMQTGFRSIVIFPLRFEGGGPQFGLLEVYTESEGIDPGLLTAEVESAVIEPVAAMVRGALARDFAASRDPSRWFTDGAAARRMSVWIAVGMVESHLGIGKADALAVLRSYVWAHDEDIDGVAELLVEQSLPIEVFGEPPLGPDHGPRRA